MRTPLKAALTAAAASLALLFPTMAFADQVDTTVGANGTTTVALSGGSAQSDVTYWIFSNANRTNCDAADGSPATVTISVSGGAGLSYDTDLALAGDQHSLTFTACGTPTAGQRLPVRFVASAAASWSVSASVADTNGQYNVHTANFTFTATAPTNTAPTVVLGGVANGGSYEFGQVPTATCQASDAEDSNEIGQLSISAVTGVLSSYGLGSQTATCTYTDSGNLSATATATYSIVDTTNPTVFAPADVIAEATSASGAVVTFSAPTGSDNVANPITPTCDQTSGAVFPLGTTTVTCSVTDEVGLVGSDSFTVTVQDTTAPTMTGGGLPSSVEATGEYTVVDFALPTAHDAVDGDIVPECDYAPDYAFPVGTTTVTCSAADSLGHESQTTFDIVVTDHTPPTISVPTLADIEATGPGGAPVDYTVTATDLVDGGVPVTCDPASGSTFALGTTVVICSASDAHGNPATATFNVEVVDTTRPTLTVPNPIVVEAIGPDGNAVGFVASATDLVDTEVQVSCIPPSGSQFSVGAHTVNCTAVDDSGNQDQDSFTVTVTDTTPPALTLPANITEEQAGPAGNAVSFAATATDIVDGGVPVTCDPASGSTFPRGTTTVSCSATDAHNNLGSGSFTVTVQDTIAPTITNLVRTPAGVDGTSPDSTGWNRTDVTFTWNCEDSGSGPVTASNSETLSEEGAALKFEPTCADVAGNTAKGDEQTVNIDKSAPTFGFTSTPASTSYDVCTSPAQPTGSWSDPLSTVNQSTVTTSWTGPAPGALGTWVFSTQAADYATNVADAVTRSYAVSYGSAYSGVLQPINLDGRSRFKLGSTIPVKFKLMCGTTPITDALATLRLTKADSAPDPGVDEAVSTSAATAGNLFRYDASGQQYIFNLNTKATYTNPGGSTVAPAVGTWTLFINLGDGTPSKAVTIQISK